MDIKYTWREAKRLANLEKHRLDFIDADYVIESPYRLDIETIRNGEYRQQSFAYVFERLMVLTVVYIPNEKPHIMGFEVQRYGYGKLPITVLMGSILLWIVR